MSYGQKFEGWFKYADAHCMEASLDAFIEDTEDVLIGVSALKLQPNYIELSYDCSAPASMYEPTQVALERLGSFASSGVIETEFHLDGVSRESIGHGGCKSSAGLPPRHFKWDVYVAAKTGDVETLRELHEAGVDISHVLALAAVAGSPDAVRLVIAAGAKPDANILADAGNAATAEVLLAAGAPLDGEVRRSSVFAIACRRHDVATLLFERGAKIVAKDYEDIAKTLAGEGDVALLRRVAERAPEIMKVFDGTAVMRRAISSNEPVMFDFLIDHGAKAPDDFLHIAIESNATLLVENVLRSGIASCGASNKREDAMCVAAANGSIEMLELLAKYGVPIQPTSGETSPLIEAARAYDRHAIKAVTWLLDRGVPVTSVDGAGRTVLQRASFAEVSALLVERGADRSQIDWNEMAEEDKETLHRLLGD